MPQRGDGADDRQQGALCALAAFAAFASHDAIIKALGSTLSPVQMLFFATLFGFPLVGLMLMQDRTDGTLLPRHPWWVALRTLSAAVGALSAFYAFTVLPLAQVYAILFAAPPRITLLAIPILGERVRLRRGLAVLAGLGFLGMLLVIAAYRAGEAVVIAPMQYSQFLWATLWGLVFFAEAPDAATLLGAGIVIASGTYIVLREGRASRTRPVLAARSRAGTPTAPALPPSAEAGRPPRDDAAGPRA